MSTDFSQLAMKKSLIILGNKKDMDRQTLLDFINKETNSA